MLGPEAVERAVVAMRETAEDLALGIAEQYISPSPPDREPLKRYWDARVEEGAKCAVFLSAAREALRQTPDTMRP